jgi:hypothetical protein
LEGHQRGKNQEESLYYEHKKHDGSLPLIGVNTFLPKDHGGDSTGFAFSGSGQGRSRLVA